MLGLVERTRRDRRRLKAAVDLIVAFERMRRHAPAAAYLFGRTLHEARASLLDDHSPREEKIALVESEIARAAPAGAAPDAGLSLLALRLVRALLIAQGERPGRQLAGLGLIDGLVRDIASHGAGGHRGIEERDRLSPDDDGVRAMLLVGPWTCVAQMAEAVGRSNGDGSAPAPLRADVALAMCDVRQEASLGRLASSLDALDAAIDGLR